MRGTGMTDQEQPLDIDYECDVTECVDCGNDVEVVPFYRGKHLCYDCNAKRRRQELRETIEDIGRGL